MEEALKELMALKEWIRTHEWDDPKNNDGFIDGWVDEIIEILTNNKE
jgi:hypothetical protein